MMEIKINDNNIMTDEVTIIPNVTSSSSIQLMAIDNQVHIKYISGDLKVTYLLSDVIDSIEKISNINNSANLLKYHLKNNINDLEIKHARNIKRYLDRYLLKHDFNFKRIFSGIRMFIIDVLNALIK